MSMESQNDLESKIFLQFLSNQASHQISLKLSHIDSQIRKVKSPRVTTTRSHPYSRTLTLRLVTKKRKL